MYDIFTYMNGWFLCFSCIGEYTKTSHGSGSMGLPIAHFTRTAVVKDVCHNFYNELPKSVVASTLLALVPWYVGWSIGHGVRWVCSLRDVCFFFCRCVCRRWFISMFVGDLYLHLEDFKLDIGHSPSHVEMHTCSRCFWSHDHMTLAWCQRRFYYT